MFDCMEIVENKILLSQISIFPKTELGPIFIGFISFDKTSNGHVIEKQTIVTRITIFVQEKRSEAARDDFVVNMFPLL